MSEHIKIENLASELTAAMSEYTADLTDAVKEAVEEETKEAKRELKADSPKRTGDYKKGWSSKKSYSGMYTQINTIHNRTDYQLTHLLEHGHVGRNGRRVAAIPHIKPVETKMIERFIRKVERAAHGNG